MPLTEISFRILGIPAPKGSTRGRGRAGGPGVIPNASPKNAADQADWGNCVRQAAILALAAHGCQGQIAFVGVPLALRVVWRMKRPGSHFVKTGAAAGTVSPKAPTLCMKAPDNSKLLRALEDHFNKLVWDDDSRVAISAQRKVYAAPGDEGASVQILALDARTGETLQPGIVGGMLPITP